MKKLVILLCLFIIPFAYAGKEATIPSAILLNSDKVELIGAEFLWGSDPVNNICRVTYRVWNNDRTSAIREIVYDIEGTDFTALVNGFGATLESRLETSIWQDIQNEFDLVP